MIEVNNLVKSFDLPKKRKKHAGPFDPRERGDKFFALEDINFSVKSGELVGLIGANGAGKTTLLRLLATSLKPTTGSIFVDGACASTEPHEVRRKIGFLSGITSLYGRLTPFEVLNFTGQMHGLSGEELSNSVNKIISDLDLNTFANRKCDLLSSGMKQRVSIARSILHNPKVVIFDEPTTGLDITSAQTVLSIIEQFKKDNKSVILSTHHMHEVDRLCDSVVIIDEGKTCFTGSVKQMREDSHKEHLDEAYLGLIAKAKDQGEVSNAS